MLAVLLLFAFALPALCYVLLFPAFLNHSRTLVSNLAVKASLVMQIQQLFIAVVLISVLLLHGCNEPGTDAVLRAPDSSFPHKMKHNASRTVSDIGDEAGALIDINITQALLEEAGPGSNLFIPVTRPLSTLIRKASKADTFRYSGRLLLDATEQNYFEAVEGALLNIEIKFR